MISSYMFLMARIYVVKNSGFCFGVKRAIKLAFSAVKKERGEVFSLGPLIHNPQMVEDLKEKGVNVVEDLSEIEEGCLIIRSHGVHPEILKTAKRKRLRIIDATCPFVKKAQNNAKLLYDEGYQVVVVGEADHPEVKSIVGYAKDKALVLNHKTNNINLAKLKKIGVVAQTTLNIDSFKELIDKLIHGAKEIKIYNTICNATSLMHKKTLKMAQKVDLMIVVGGYNSANTTRLAKLCKTIGTKTCHVETSIGLKKNWFKDITRIGVTAGTSTPPWIIQDVVKKIKTFV